jgi:repressor LexA
MITRWAGMKMQHYKQARTDITPRQLQILRAIATFADKYSYLPTIAELADRLSIGRSTAFEHIAELRRKGLLCESQLKARSSRPTPKAQKLLKYTRTNSQQQFPRPQGIPLLGKVAAGKPVETFENRETLSLPDCFGNSDDVFALEVSGNSMLEEGICDGDYIICRKTQTARNGQIVVALTENEDTTLKKFYRGNSRVRLQPANKDYEPIFTNDCRIQAVAVGLLKKF